MMRRPQSMHTITLFILLCVLCSLGCARAPIRFGDKVVLQPKTSAEGSIPLRVCLQLTPEFTNNEFAAMMRVVKLGEGMRSGAEGSLRFAFRDVVILGTRKANFPSDTCDLIALPSIGQRGISIVGGVVPFLRCFVETKWTIKDKVGRTLYINTFFGQSDINDRFFHVDEDMSTCMAGAVKQQYEEFVNHVNKTDWWRDGSSR